MKSLISILTGFLLMGAAIVQRMVIRDFKAGVSYGRPLYQQVEGIQMKETDSFTLGLRYSI